MLEIENYGYRNLDGREGLPIAHLPFEVWIELRSSTGDSTAFGEVFTAQLDFGDQWSSGAVQFATADGTTIVFVVQDGLPANAYVQEDGQTVTSMPLTPSLVVSDVPPTDDVPDGTHTLFLSSWEVVVLDSAPHSEFGTGDGDHAFDESEVESYAINPEWSRFIEDVHGGNVSDEVLSSAGQCIVRSLVKRAEWGGEAVEFESHFSEYFHFAVPTRWNAEMEAFTVVGDTFGAWLHERTSEGTWERPGFNADATVDLHAAMYDTGRSYQEYADLVEGVVDSIRAFDMFMARQASWRMPEHWWLEAPPEQSQAVFDGYLGDLRQDGIWRCINT